MKKILPPVFVGLIAMTIAACAASATQSLPASLPATATATEAPASSAGNSQLSGSAGMVAPTSAPVATVSFAKDIMPILSNSCIKCHGVEDVKKGLDMTSYAKLMTGSFKGPVVVPGNASQSTLVDVLVQGKMPKRGQNLPADEIQMITDWINTGALNN